MKVKFRTADFLLILTVAAVAVAALFSSNILSKPGSVVEVRCRGEVYKTLPLSADTTLDIDGKCMLVISGGRAWVESAVCKNQICVRHAPISRAGQSIVCLPSEITVRILGDGADFYI